MLPKQEIIDYDTQWKMVITVYFEDFIAYFLPDLYKNVDFSHTSQSFWIKNYTNCYQTV